MKSLPALVLGRVVFAALIATGLATTGIVVLRAAVPTWSVVGSMSTPRYHASATVLADGRVLVAGGFSSSALNTAEIFDPATNNWSPTGSMNTPRGLHVAAALGDGRVLVAGGSSSSTEIYDPTTGTWSPAASLPIGVFAPVAAALPDGRVLVAGTFGSTFGNAYVYDPIANAWTATANQTHAIREFGAATVLNDGRVFVTGGLPGSSAVASAEIYDPTSNMWSVVASMSLARAWHRAVTLDDGRVLIVGGFNPSGPSNYANSEVYDPVSNSWTGPIGIPGVGGQFPAAALRRDGQVLAVGGFVGLTSSAAALFDPLTNTWASAAAMSGPRLASVAVPVAGARTLVAGGHSGSAPLSTAEVFGSPNNPPVADAGSDQTIQGCVNCLALVMLDASGSTDGDADTLSYTWKAGSTVLATTSDPITSVSLALALGSHTLMLVVQDGAGGISSDTIEILVEDGLAEANVELAQCQADQEALASSVEATLAAIEQNLRTEFNNPTFQIPGGAPMARLQNLGGAISSLNRGQKMGLYRALGGR